MAVVGFLLALWAWYISGDWRWGLGGIVLVSNWPFTLIKIMPANNRLMAMSPSSPDAELRNLMEQWGLLHGVRSILGVLATVIFLWAMN